MFDYIRKPQGRNFRQPNFSQFRPTGQSFNPNDMAFLDNTQMQFLDDVDMLFLD